jgi:tRNA acetyltransferase TAN1
MVASDFNLIISTPRGYENDACSEIWFLLGEIGDRESIVEKSGVSGLIVAKTVLSPFKVVEGLRKMLKEQPWEFRHTFRVIPVEVVVHTRLEEIRKASLEISSKVLDNETFRVTVEKRHTTLSTREIIEAVAEDIDKKVDLDNPDKIVLVEVLGGLTGVSVIKPKDILSVAKEKSH